jgi:hypothetical protein
MLIALFAHLSQVERSGGENGESEEEDGQTEGEEEVTEGGGGGWRWGEGGGEGRRGGDRVEVRSQVNYRSYQTIQLCTHKDSRVGRGPRWSHEEVG